MSRIVPPVASGGSASPEDPKRSEPGMAAQKPGVTTPAAPSLGASAPPTAGGIPANRLPGAGVPGVKPAAPGLRPPVRTVVQPAATDEYDVATPGNGHHAPAPPRPASASPGGSSHGSAPAAPRPPMASPGVAGNGSNGSNGAVAKSPAPVNPAARPAQSPGAAPGPRPPAGPTGPRPIAGVAAPSPSGPVARPLGGMPPIEELKSRPIGRILTKMGKVTREQVVEALDFQKKKGGAIGRILIDLGYIKSEDLNIGLAAQRGYQLVSLEGKNITPEMIKAVPSQIATTQKVLPIEFDPATKKLVVAMANHENFRALDDLRQFMGYDVQAVLADPDLIDKLIAKHYNSAADSLGDILSELNDDRNA